MNAILSKMISVFVLVAAAMMTLAVVSAFAIGPGGAVPMQAAIEAYSQFQFSRSRVVLSAEQISRAKNPSAFAKEMSAVTYSEGVVYSATNIMRQTRTRQTGARRDLPYPPKELWCARLNIEESADIPRYIFIARHADAAGEEWVVHEPLLTKGLAKQIADTVQCAS